MNELQNLGLEDDLGLDIFQFDNARQVLAQYIEGCQAIKKSYSYRHFSRKLGYRSPSYAKSLIQGDRPFTNKVISEWVVLMKLKDDQRKYFELLVKQEQISPNNPLHEEYQEMLEILRTRTQIKTVEEERVAMTFSWLHLIIRELALLRDARIDLPSVHRCLSKFKTPFTKQEILVCIEELQKGGFLVNQDGEWHVDDPSITFEDEKISSLLPVLLKQFHREGIKFSLEALDLPMGAREYGALVVATTPDKFRLFKKRLKEFSHEAMEILETPPNESTLVTSFTFQFYPVAKST